jgi:predicted metalloprotease with PDZ domain
VSKLHVILRPVALSQQELAVELHVPASYTRRGLTLAMAAWTPGSYLIRDHARNLDQLVVKNSRGKVIPITKTDKQHWSVPGVGTGLVISYRLFCYELSPRTNYLDANMAHLVGAATFLYLEGRQDLDWTISFQDWPSHWTIATPLPLQLGGYYAKNLDTLLDSPFLFGELARQEWSQHGARFDFAMVGDHRGDAAPLFADTKRVIDECVDIFGGLPFDHYQFLLTFASTGDGALEHANGVSVVAGQGDLNSPRGTRNLATLLAHELLHAWNGKRLRSRDFAPLDYTRENPTRTLWFQEGVTTFMENILAVRAGIVSADDVLDEFAAMWTDLLRTPGRFRQSLEACSFDAWTKLYKPSPAAHNVTIDYYVKGCLVGWLLDAKIRLATGGQKGLPDWLRLLWDEFKEKPYADQDLPDSFEVLTGEAANPFWDRYIRGTAELDASDLERAYGIKMTTCSPWDATAKKFPGNQAEIDRDRTWSGLILATPQPVIKSIAPDSPATTANLSYGMEILAVNQWRTLTAADVTNRLADIPPGGHVLLTTCKAGVVSPHELTMGKTPFKNYEINPVETPTQEQALAFLGLFGHPHPSMR